MVALDMKEVPGSCCECALWTYADEGITMWCVPLDKEIKDMCKKLRGCPIKGRVRKCDVIREIKGN